MRIPITATKEERYMIAISGRTGSISVLAQLRNHPLEDDDEFNRALEIIKKKKEDSLALIRTHLKLKMEAAESLAKAEERSIHRFYTVGCAYVAMMRSNKKTRSKSFSTKSAR